MDVFARILLEMSMWVRNRPPLWQAYVMATVVLLAAAIVGFDWLGYWPDWARTEGLPRTIG
jgi:hypothetical protein